MKEEAALEKVGQRKTIRYTTVQQRAGRRQKLLKCAGRCQGSTGLTAGPCLNLQRATPQVPKGGP